MRLLCGPGILSSTTAPSAATTSWTSASSARPTRLPRRPKSALWHGVSAITHSTSTAFPVGSRPVKSALWTTVTGSSRSTAVENVHQTHQDSGSFERSPCSAHLIHAHTRGKLFMAVTMAGK